MAFNCAAFIVIVSCYTIMYCSVRGSQAWNSNDSRVAKRMALLVFTDFFCWAPITFFSLTAAFGYDLISLEDAKVFTIFVLPLNSCANPFLYAIFTKQFKKDCSLICRRLEEPSRGHGLSRLSNRNISLSWGSSRRLSALNSFFNTSSASEKREIIKHHTDGTATGFTLAVGDPNSWSSLGKGIVSLRSAGKAHFTNGKDQIAGKNTSKYSLDSMPQTIVKSSRQEDDRHNNGRLKRSPNFTRDSMWCAPQTPVKPRRGLFLLQSLENSPGGARRNSLSTKASLKWCYGSKSNKHEKTLGSSKSMLLSKGLIKPSGWNCCHISQRRRLSERPMLSPGEEGGAEYELMSSVDNNGYMSMTGEDQTRQTSLTDASDCVYCQPDNNNHNYVNITEEMLSGLRVGGCESSHAGSEANSPRVPSIHIDCVSEETVLLHPNPYKSDVIRNEDYVKLDPPPEGAKATDTTRSDKRERSNAGSQLQLPTEGMYVNLISLRTSNKSIHNNSSLLHSLNLEVKYQVQHVAEKVTIDGALQPAEPRTHSMPQLAATEADQNLYYVPESRLQNCQQNDKNNDCGNPSTDHVCSRHSISNLLNGKFN